MYEFFRYDKHAKYLRAQEFVKDPANVTFTFQYWTDSVQQRMNTRLLHVGARREENANVATGVDDSFYLAEFQGMWRKMLENLHVDRKEIFREEIEHRLRSEFGHCGTLGKEFIPT